MQELCNKISFVHKISFDKSLNKKHEKVWYENEKNLK